MEVEPAPLTCHLHISLPSESILIAAKSPVPTFRPLQFPVDTPARMTEPFSAAAAVRKRSSHPVPFCQKHTVSEKKVNSVVNTSSGHDI